MERRYKVWIEICKSAVRKNIRIFRAFLNTNTKLYSVVKSNAYGHGLVQFSQIASECGVDGFCVDSVVEGVKLRMNGITKPILVLGYTLPALYAVAKKHHITVTIANREAFIAWKKAKQRPDFHIKIDSGMHRQGFQPEDVPHCIALLTKSKIGKDYVKGIYTHCAMAKDADDTAFTRHQLDVFKKVCALFEGAGCNGLMRHVSATGGTLLGKEFHMDMVRVGIGLYGVWPSSELKKQLGATLTPIPVLALYSCISEIKTIKKGEGIGYDLTEVAKRDTRIAVIPIGYWHGIPRAASSIGCIMVGTHKVKIVGRVSMDMIVVDCTDVSCKVGDTVRIDPSMLAENINASPYEVITRINPLIHKKLVR